MKNVFIKYNGLGINVHTVKTEGVIYRLPRCAYSTAGTSYVLNRMWIHAPSECADSIDVTIDCSYGFGEDSWSHYYIRSFEEFKTLMAITGIDNIKINN